MGERILHSLWDSRHVIGKSIRAADLGFLVPNVCNSRGVALDSRIGVHYSFPTMLRGEEDLKKVESTHNPTSSIYFDPLASVTMFTI